MKRLLLLVAILMSSLDSGAAPVKVTLCGPKAEGDGIDQRITNSCAAESREYEAIDEIRVSADIPWRVEVRAHGRLPMSDGTEGPIVSIADFAIDFERAAQARNFVAMVTEGQISKIVAISKKTPDDAFRNLTGVARVKSSSVFVYRNR